MSGLEWVVQMDYAKGFEVSIFTMIGHCHINVYACATCVGPLGTLTREDMMLCTNTIKTSS